MSDKLLHVFVNPTAGRGRAAKRLREIREIVAGAGLDVHVHESREPGHLESDVHEFARTGGKRVVVAGGDGSVHEAANGILRSGEEATLSVIPSGTGNDFAKAAGITLAWRDAAALLADNVMGDAASRRIDAGIMNGRYFVNGAGIGFDARVTALARSIRWPIGDVVYLFAIFRAFAGGIATPAVTIKAGDGSILWNGPLTLASISNGPFVGGMFHIAPMARHDDGHMDLLIAAPVSRLRIVRLLPKLIEGKHLSEPEITHQPVTAIAIECETDIVSHLDGEVQPPARRFSIEVMPAVLRLL